MASSFSFFLPTSNQPQSTTTLFPPPSSRTCLSSTSHHCRVILSLLLTPQFTLVYPPLQTCMSRDELSAVQEHAARLRLQAIQLIQMMLDLSSTPENERRATESIASILDGEYEKAGFLAAHLTPQHKGSGIAECKAGRGGSKTD